MNFNTYCDNGLKAAMNTILESLGAAVIHCDSRLPYFPSKFHCRDKILNEHEPFWWYEKRTRR